MEFNVDVRAPQRASVTLKLSIALEMFCVSSLSSPVSSVCGMVEKSRAEWISHKVGLH